MTQRPTLVRIASPCHESWATMTPTATGRHCAACQKTVVDFTQKTDTEILAALRQAAGETCGRLRLDQVGRPLVAPTTAPRWRIWLGAALAVGGGLGAGRAAAQVRTNYYAGPQPAASPSGSATAAVPALQAYASAATPAAAVGPRTVRGVVQDASTHEGLPGVTVILKGTLLGTNTDATGAFELAVPGNAGELPLLTFSYIGYVEQESPVTPGSPQPLTVALVTDVKGFMGEVVVTTFNQPWPWHPRRLFNWGKHRVTKPFQN